MDGRTWELQEGYRALRGNSCWQWLMAELALKREYLLQELLSAASWESCCRTQGGLLLLQSLLGQIEAIEKGGEEL